MSCNVMYCNVMYVCMYVSLHFPFAPQYFPQKNTSKNIEFFQIFGKRMQEAQASKKAGRGNRAWDPCFATPAPRRLRLVERHQIAARYVGDSPPKKIVKGEFNQLFFLLFFSNSNTRNRKQNPEQQANKINNHNHQQKYLITAYNIK